MIEGPKEDGDKPEKRMMMMIGGGNHCCATLARVPLRPLGESKEPICISVNPPKPPPFIPWGPAMHFEMSNAALILAQCTVQ